MTDINALSSADRKTYPVAAGFLDYFPLAVAEVAHVSYVGNEQHNPDTPVHWDRSKSQDEADALMRHFLSRGTIDSDGVRHSAKMAWRAMALLQKELELESPREVKYYCESPNHPGGDKSAPIWTYAEYIAESERQGALVMCSACLEELKHGY